MSNIEGQIERVDFVANTTESGAENDRTVDADQKQIFDFLRQKFVEAIALIDAIKYGK